MGLCSPCQVQLIVQIPVDIHRYWRTPGELRLMNGDEVGGEKQVQWVKVWEAEHSKTVDGVGGNILMGGGVVGIMSGHLSQRVMPSLRLCIT